MEWIIYLIFLIIGYMFGSYRKSDNKEEPKKINIPNLNPMTKYQEHISKKEEEKSQRELAIMLENIENYDGTGNHQKNVG